MEHESRRPGEGSGSVVVDPASRHSELSAPSAEQQSGAVVPFRGRQHRRFVAVQFLATSRWRAAVFIGWNVDLSAPHDGHVTTHAEAVARAKDLSRRLGLPFISDRCAMLGGGIYPAPLS